MTGKNWSTQCEISTSASSCATKSSCSLTSYPCTEDPSTSSFNWKWEYNLWPTDMITSVQ